MIPRDAAGFLLEPTDVIADAHDAGLKVVGWTFRRENSFLPADYRVGTDPAGIGEPGRGDQPLPRRRDGLLLHRQPRHRRRGRPPR